MYTFNVPSNGNSMGILYLPYLVMTKASEYSQYHQSSLYRTEMAIRFDSNATNGEWRH